MKVLALVCEILEAEAVQELSPACRKSYCHPRRSRCKIGKELHLTGMFGEIADGRAYGILGGMLAVVCSVNVE